MAKMLERLSFEKSYFIELLQRSRDKVGGSLNAANLRMNYISTHLSKGKNAPNQGTGPSLPNKNDVQK